MHHRLSRVALIIGLGLFLAACGIFNIALSTNSLSIAAGESATIEITLSPMTPYGGNFTVELVGTSPLVIAEDTFSLPMANAVRSVPLEISAPVGAAPGVYEVQVKVSSDGVERTAQLAVTVTAPVVSGELACQHVFDEASTVRAVTTDAVGNIYVSGTRAATATDPQTGFIAKLDSACALQWVKTGLGPTHLAVAADGRIVGISAGAIMVLDAAANEQMRVPAPDPDSGITISDGFFKYALTLDNNGRAIVGGMITEAYTNASGGTDWLEFPVVRAYNLADLSVAWTVNLRENYTELCYSMCRVNSVAVDADGNVGVTGFTTAALDGYVMNGGTTPPNSPVLDAFAAVISAGGAELWKQQYGTEASDSGSDVAFDGAGNLLVVSETSGSYPGYTSLYGSGEYALHKFSGSGNLLWVRQGNPVSGIVVPRGLDVDSQGNILLGLMSMLPNATYTDIGDLAGTGLKLDDDGATQVWLRNILPGTVWSSTVDADDNLILGGRIYEGTYPSYTSLRGIVAKYHP